MKNKSGSINSGRSWSKSEIDNGRRPSGVDGRTTLLPSHAKSGLGWHRNVRIYTRKSREAFAQQWVESGLG